MKLILASKSPRRKDILNIFLNDYEIKTCNSKEIYENKFDIVTNIMSISKSKANIELRDNEILLAADTVVVYDNLILGKPKDIIEAREYLNILSNKTHLVITAFTIKTNEKILCDYEISKVKFKNLDKDIINSYLLTNEWKDKAGGYGIQTKGAILVDSIEGDYQNVVGLPISRISDVLLQEFNFNLLG